MEKPSRYHPNSLAPEGALNYVPSGACIKEQPMNQDFKDPSTRVSIQMERETRKAKLASYREAWAQSEWVLDFLRSESGTPTTPATEEEIIQWATKSTN
jgi:hypothetical protein